jgi:hypothetical protein
VTIRVGGMEELEAGRDLFIAIIGGGTVDSMAVAAAAGSKQRRRRGHYDLLGRGRGAAGGESKRGQGGARVRVSRGSVVTPRSPRHRPRHTARFSSPFRGNRSRARKQLDWKLNAAMPPIELGLLALVCSCYV